MDLPIIYLEGSPTRMGESFGEICRVEIRQLCERRIRSARAFATLNSGRPRTEDDVLSFARRCLDTAAAWDPEGYDEFIGIAHGADVSPESLYAMQGLTDIRDWLAAEKPADSEGCSAFVLRGDQTADGHLLLGQTWDLLTDNMEYVRLVHRRPEDGPATVSLTLTGCLTLIGLNEEGIAVGTTNLKTSDARAGLHYLHLLHKAIRCHSLEEAAAAIMDAPRMAAHYYMLADGAGRAVGIECSATRAREIPLPAGFMVHCNHLLTNELLDLEIPLTTESSGFRQERMEYLLRTHAGSIDVEEIKGMFADHEGGNLAICRHDVPPEGISTNACVIMSPETREIHACRGQSEIGRWVSYSFR